MSDLAGLLSAAVRRRARERGARGSRYTAARTLLISGGARDKPSRCKHVYIRPNRATTGATRNARRASSEGHGDVAPTIAPLAFEILPVPPKTLFIVRLEDS
jgi:hypothetical protein